MNLVTLVHNLIMSE